MRRGYPYAMSNPQQPELARSRKTPAQDQDAVAGVVEGQHQPGTSAPTGPVPVDNQPGHHPAHEQDKPDLDKFAERLGVVEPGTVAADGEGDGDGARATRNPAGPGPAAAHYADPPAAPRGRGRLVAVAAVAVMAVLAFVGVFVGRRRRSGRR